MAPRKPIEELKDSTTKPNNDNGEGFTPTTDKSSSSSSQSKVQTGPSLFDKDDNATTDEPIPKRVKLTKKRRSPTTEDFLISDESSSEHSSSGSSSSSNTSDDELLSHRPSKRAKTSTYNSSSEQLALFTRGELPFVGEGSIAKPLKKMAKQQRKKWDQLSLRNSSRLLSTVENVLSRQHKDEAAQNLQSGRLHDFTFHYITSPLIFHYLSLSQVGH